jgi:hypothetical protein
MIQVAALLVVCSLLSVQTPASKSKPAAKSASNLFARNLLVNGNAESGNTVPGWSAQPGFSAETYGSHSIVACQGCGARYFRLHWDGGDPQLSSSQTVSIEPIAAAIDAGKVTVKIAGLFGSILKSETTIYLLILFKSADGQDLGALQTPPVDPNDLPNPQVGEAAFVPLDATGSVPPGTRKIEVRLVAKRTGTESKGLAFADNLSLVLSA